jgi:hypothetical protein
MAEELLGMWLLLLLLLALLLLGVVERARYMSQLLLLLLLLLDLLMGLPQLGVLLLTTCVVKTYMQIMFSSLLHKVCVGTE